MAERPEDLSLPASVVTRIVKEALPEGVNISKEARTAIGKAASVFILYSTACANNFALKSKRKTLNAADVFSALEDMEFEHFAPELKNFLDVYKVEQKGRKEAAADRKKKQQAAATAVVIPADTQPGSQNELPTLDSEPMDIVSNGGI
ncbi:DNA polymerase epsilon subunit 3-like [Halichondria panicea]|uniref:DNA polymerase epsilon subunit 3-like n=1 Tax=Halichondria panicea TaxID=6063 RepID=UPI00312BC5A0